MKNKTLILMFEGEDAIDEPVEEFKVELNKAKLKWRDYITEDFGSGLQIAIDISKDVWLIISVSKVIHKLLQKYKRLTIKNRTIKGEFTHSTTQEEIKKEIKEVYKKTAF